MMLRDGGHPSFDYLGLDLSASIIARFRTWSIPPIGMLMPAEDSPVHSITRCRGSCRALAAAAGTHVKTLRCSQACDISPLTPSQADGLLRGLPELQRLEAHIICSEAVCWAPAAAANLAELTLSGHNDQEGPSVQLDAAGIARSSKLQKLNLYELQVANWAAVAALTELRRLMTYKVSVLAQGSMQQHEQAVLGQQQEGEQAQQQVQQQEQGPQDVDTILQPLVVLQHLQELHLLGCTISAAGWRLVAHMSALHTLTAHHVTVDGRPGAPSSGIHNLHCQTLATLPEPSAATRRGLLARLLPELEAVDTRYGHTAGAPTCLQLAEALAGHLQLRKFSWNGGSRFSTAGEPGYQWPAASGGSDPVAGLFSSMPALEELSLNFRTCLTPQQLFRDVLGCKQLRKLTFSSMEEMASGSYQWLAQELHSSAASLRLHRLSLDLGRTVVDMGWVAGLLDRRVLPVVEQVHVSGYTVAPLGLLLDTVQEQQEWLLGRLLVELVTGGRSVQVAAPEGDQVVAAEVKLVVDGISAEVCMEAVMEREEEEEEEEESGSDGGSSEGNGDDGGEGSDEWGDEDGSGDATSDDDDA